MAEEPKKDEQNNIDLKTDQKVEEDKNKPSATDNADQKSEDDLLAELDQLLHEEDPSFAKSLKQLDQDLNTVKDLQVIDVDSALAEDAKPGHKAKGLKKYFFFILPFIPRLKSKFRHLWTWLVLFNKYLLDKVTDFVFWLATDGRKHFFSWAKETAKKTIQNIQAFIKYILKLSKNQKLALIGIFLLGVLATYIINLSLKNKLIPQSKDLFVSSLADVATHHYDFDMNSGVEGFYENMRSTQNVFLLEKLIVNLKKSETSTSNPMGAFSFIIEGVNNEVVVEIKDREMEVKDTLMRKLEGLEYDYLASEDGKNQLHEILRKELNSMLITGKVKRVLFKNFVLKP